MKTYLKRPRIFAPILGEASKLSKDSINRCTVRVIMQVKGKLRDVNRGGRGQIREQPREEWHKRLVFDWDPDLVASRWSFPGWAAVYPGFLHW